jgi:FkbM family methyltransferase
MKITYGIRDNNIDVTDICYNLLLKDTIITIPPGDHNRAMVFTDPIVGVLKSIFINDKEYNEHEIINIDTINETIFQPKDINTNIQTIHQNLKIKYGSLSDEFNEQRMVANYLTGEEKVLELGANIGRNSLVIGYILKDSRNFVTLETDENTVKLLTENRDLNNMNFHIESSALSKRKLIQKDWDTMVSDIVLPGYFEVNTITLDELNSKYKIEFDTLVLDCEGAFYYILLDMPEILNNIKLIIMENDYHDYSHKEYVDKILKENNFYVDYSEPGPWGPCANNFYEVWKRN